tara:strand:+ start:7088 stop:7891 length:804 start_codon:yes stop_codon:yes gene_type:complete
MRRRDITRKTVWITGASSGIGRAIASQIASDDVCLIVSSRRTEALEQVAQDVAVRNSECIVAPLDFSRVDQAIQDANSIVAEHGPIDIAIHAAGISQKGEVRHNALQVYRDVMEVNYFGLVAVVKSVLPGMLDRGHGSIVGISSLAGKIGSSNRSGYSASKFAVCGFMDCLRSEVAPHGIHCLTVCPGYVKTDIAHNALNADGSRRQQSTSHIDGGMQPEKCAKRIVQAIHKQRDEIIIAEGINRWGPLANRLFPQLLRRFLIGRNI